MLSDEEVRQHRLAADGCNLNGCSHVEALLSDRAELVAEIERLRAVVEAAREGCNTCHKYNGDDYCCDCYHAGSGTWDALAALEVGE